jgi:hypothetical protein
MARVLVADPDHTIREMARVVLAQAGHEVMLTGAVDDLELDVASVPWSDQVTALDADLLCALREAFPYTHILVLSPADQIALRPVC